MPNSAKSWYKSKTIWASTVTVIVGLLSSFGVISAQGADLIILEAPELIVSVITTIGGVVSFYGRITAKDKLV